MMAIESSKNFEICQKKLCLPLRKDVHVYSICIGQRQEKKIQDYVQEKYNFLKILQMCGKPLHIIKKNVLQRFDNYKYFGRGNFFFL